MRISAAVTIIPQITYSAGPPARARWRLIVSLSWSQSAATPCRRWLTLH